MSGGGIDINLLGVLLGIEDFWREAEQHGSAYPRYLEIRGAVNSISSGVLSLARIIGDREAIAYAKAMVEATKAQVSTA